MNTNGIAKHYAQLTPEERFRLIMAAGSRGDEAEGNRLASAAKPIHFTFADHAPYFHAYHELLFVTFIELLEDAALFLESSELTGKLLRQSIEAGRTPKKRKTPKPVTTDETKENDAVEWPAWHTTDRAAAAVGFLVKVKMEGWKLFCARMNAAPCALWEQMDLPGLDRLKRALALAHAGGAFPSAEEMAIWANEVRPAGHREQTEADVITAERFAASLDKAFRESVRRWGG